MITTKAPMWTPIRDRILMHVRETESGCWEWAGARSRGGYGRIVMPRTQGTCVNGTPKSCAVHRVAYEVFVGPIPSGLHIDHLCRNRACCNPGHLEPVTNRENLLRGESFSGINARKTECIRGHVFDEANTYVDKRGRRQCLTCRRTWRSRKAEATASQPDDTG